MNKNNIAANGDLSLPLRPQWNLRGSLVIGKFRGNQILTPGLTMSNAKLSVIVLRLHIYLNYTWYQASRWS